MKRRETQDGIGRVHDLLMSMLVELDAATRAAGLTYYLAYGTAIGALRHHDFIPWDIDADVLIRRDEYDQVVEALRAHLPERVTLLTPGDGTDYEYLFARIGLRGVDHTQVHLDLFPLERGPSSRLAQRLYAVVTRTCCKLHLVKQMSPASRTHYGHRKRLAARAGKLLLAPVPAGALRRFFSAFTGWFASRSSGEVMVSSCGSYGLREFFHGRWFEASERVRFRDRELLVPSGCDALLQFIYGDYMTPVSDSDQARDVAFIEDHYVGPLRASGIV